jgi:hypothetical protein
LEIVNRTPLLVETLPLPDGPGGGDAMTVVLKGTFDIVPDGVATPSDEQMPILFGDEFMGDDPAGCPRFEFDMAPFKPRADIALVGKAYAPGGRPVTEMEAGLRVGNVSKTLRIFGDRHWQCASPVLPVTMSAPRPFVTMELTYDRAFGGIDANGGGFCEENLAGKGFYGEKSKRTVDGQPLPNIEDPRNLVRAFTDHPRPAGFGFCSRAWKPRAGCIGTFDEKWRKTRSPRLPVDFRFDYYNAAHPDLQPPGYLRGDEDVALANLTPGGVLRFRLPGIAPAVEVVKTDRYEVPFDRPATEQVVPLPMNLDTLCLIPDEMRLYLVWRGVLPMKSLDMLDVKSVEIRTD